MYSAKAEETTAPSASYSFSSFNSDSKPEESEASSAEQTVSDELSSSSDTTFEMTSYERPSSDDSSSEDDSSQKNYENQSGYVKPRKPINKKAVSLAAAAVIAIGLAGGIGAWLYNTKDERAERKAAREALKIEMQQRNNTVSLIENYSEQGLYDNALSLINALLLRDNGDLDGNHLFDSTADLKKQSDPHSGFSGQTFTDAFGTESYDVSQKGNALAVAQKYVDKALYDDAETVLTAMLTVDPDDGDVKQMLDLAQTFRSRAEEETLAAEAEQAALNRSNTLKQVNEAVDSGLYDQALSVLNALIAQNPDDEEVRNLLDRASFLKGEADKAEEERNARLAQQAAEEQQRVQEQTAQAVTASANAALEQQLAQRSAFVGNGFNPVGPAGVEGQNPPVYSDTSNIIGNSSSQASTGSTNAGAAASSTSRTSSQASTASVGEAASSASRLLSQAITGSTSTGTATSSTSRSSSQASTSSTSSGTAASSAGRSSSQASTGSTSTGAASANTSRSSSQTSTASTGTTNSAPANQRTTRTVTSTSSNASSAVAQARTPSANASSAAAQANTSSANSANASASRTSRSAPLVDRSTGNVATPSTRQEALDRATQLTDDGRYDDALRILNDLMIRNPNDKDALLRMYRAADEKRELLKGGTRSSSKGQAEQAAEQKKTEQLALAQKYLDSGDYEKALQILNELAKTNKDDSRIQSMLNKASSQKKAAESKAAAEAKRKAEQEAAQKAAEAKAAKEKADKLAQIQKYLDAGDYEKAQQLLNGMSAADKKGSDVQALMNKAASQKKAAEAKKAQEEAAKKAAEQKKAAEEKAAKEKADKLAQIQKYLDSGDYEKAQQLLNGMSAADKKGSDVQALMNKAASQKKAAEAKKAQEEAAKKAAEQKKAAEEKAAKEKADKLAQIQKYLDSGDYEKAQQLLNGMSAADKKGSDVQALMNKAAAQKKAADQKKAEEAAAKKKAEEEAIRKAAEAKAAKEKADKLAQIQKYLDAGDYEKAQQLLNGMSAADKKGSDVQALMNKAAAQKKAADQKKAEEAAAKKKAEEEAIRKAAEAKAAKEKADKLAQVQKYLDAGDYEKAQQLLNGMSAADKKGSDVQALMNKAEAQKKAAEAKKAKEAEEARIAAEKAAQAKKEAERAALQKNIEDEIAKGKAALASGNIEEALSHFNKAKGMLPADDASYSGKKLSEMAQELYNAAENTSDASAKKKLADAAKTMANEAVAKGSNDAGSHYVLGMEALKNKNYALAETELQKAVKDNPNNANFYYQLGRAQAQQGKYQAAQTSFLSSTKLDSNYAPAQYNLGFVSERLNNMGQALTAYRKATQIDSNYERAYIATGRVLTKQGDYTAAADAFEKAIKINPANAQTYQEQGAAYASAENYPAAENSFKKAIAYMDKTKEDPATYYNLSTVMLAQGKNSDALSYAKQSYDLKNGAKGELKNNIIYNYALVQEKAGNTEMAKALYNEVLLNDSKNVKAMTNLGALYIETGDAASAISVLTKAYELENANFEVNNNLGNAYNKQEDFVQAVTYYQKALKISPKDNTVRENLAKAYVSAKQYDNAKTTYEDVVATDSKNWEAYLELSKVCIALGDNESAKTYLTYLQKNNPSYKMAEVSKLLASIKN